MSGANDAYKALFAHFNMLTKDEKTAPFWRCEQSGARIRYELSGAVTSGDQLAESTQSLAQELENVILGTPFMVRHANREIVIERRAESH
jgi:hypothetical protein